MNEEQNVVAISVDGKKSFKEKVKEKAQKVKNWGAEHKDVLVVFVPLLISSGVELIKISKRDKTIKEDRRLKENYIYDRSAGHYYELKRKPTNREWIMIDEGKRNENLGIVLSEMNLLK